MCICLYVHLSICASVYRCIYLSIYPYVDRSIYQSVYLTIISLSLPNLLSIPVSLSPWFPLSSLPPSLPSCLPLSLSIPSRPRSDPRLTPRRHRFGLTSAPKRPRIDPESTPNQSRIDHEPTPDRSTMGPNGPQWIQHLTRLDPDSTPNRPQFDPFSPANRLPLDPKSMPTRWQIDTSNPERAGSASASSRRVRAGQTLPQTCADPRMLFHTRDSHNVSLPESLHATQTMSHRSAVFSWSLCRRPMKWTSFRSSLGRSGAARGCGARPGAGRSLPPKCVVLPRAANAEPRKSAPETCRLSEFRCRVPQ